MTPRLFYSDRYYADIGLHVFPMVKYRLVRDALTAGGAAGPDDFAEPGELAEEDALRVHTRAYWQKVLHGFGLADEARLELPYSPELAEAFRRMAQGSVLAARRALEGGFAANLGGGFHHAFPDHGEGFCMLNDVAIALRHLLAHRAVERAAVIDTDLHQGNGTAAIFEGDPSVFTYSIHQEHNYPHPKARSDLDVGLADGTAGPAYLERLGRDVPAVLDRQRPQVVAYVAGTDPYEDDQLGAIRLTREDLRRRDALVLEECRRRSVPVFVTLAGGYARRLEDTVRLHAATVELGLARPAPAAAPGGKDARHA
ncbi:MAG TPA: histone deacetylase [Candidatus Saccharimonadales bacterium]|nr:histone deacetylase [Candidatus Saccharimonadales bacterium]